MSEQESLVRVVEDAAPEPHPSRIPYERACRWWPLWEDKVEVALAVSVFVTQRAYVRLCTFARSDLQREVGGWMVGKWYVDKESDQQYVIVDTVIPAEHTQQGSAFLTFTKDSQIVLHDTMQKYYPNKVVVGWYHTHPRMGVFFSKMDMWLHENFFPELWQVALVIEPVGSLGGFFIRQVDGSLDDRRYAGFYELINWKRQSVMQWRNMTPDPASQLFGR